MFLLHLCFYFAKTFFCCLLTKMPCFVNFLSVLKISLEITFFTKKCPLVHCTAYVLRRTPRSTARAHKKYLCGALAHIWCETHSQFLSAIPWPVKPPLHYTSFFRHILARGPQHTFVTVPVGRTMERYDIFPGRAYLLAIYRPKGYIGRLS